MPRKKIRKEKSLLTLIRDFADPKVCEDYVYRMRWPDGKITCPHCNSDKKIYRFSDNKRFKCKDCGKQFTAIKGTIFENTKIPLTLWLPAMHILWSSKKGISSYFLAEYLQITQKTAWFILHRLRSAAKERNIILSGAVEADETYVGGKEKNKHAHKKVKDNQGRSLKTRTAVFGLIERKGKLIARVVDSVGKEKLFPIIKECVEDGSVIYTDEYMVYRNLNKYNYTHEHIYHGNKEFVKGNCHTNTIEGFWSLFKRGILGVYHQVSPQHLHRYLDEFVYRYNNRHLLGEERFLLSLSKIGTSRLKYKDLIRDGKERKLRKAS